MTILIINHHPNDVIGGSEIQCDLLARQLTRFGHTIIYLAIDGASQEYGTPYTVESGPLIRATLQRILQQRHPDVVYWRFNKRRFLPSILVLKHAGVKVVFGISHGNDVKRWAHKVRIDTANTRTKLRMWWRILRSGLSSFYHHFGYYGVDGVIAQLKQQCGRLPVSHEILVYNSVDSAAQPFAWKRPFIVWVATVKPSKNPELYLQLAERLQEFPVDCLMVGKIINTDYHYFQEPSRTPPNFYYLGEKSYFEVNGILQQALFLAHTCSPEGLPNIFLQAWMQGKPTLSLFYDPDHMIHDHQLGYLSGKFEQFVCDAQTLIENQPLREEMGQRAKTFAEAHFNLSRNARHVEDFFLTICHKQMGANNSYVS